MRFRSLFLAGVLPLAVTGAVYGCSGDPTPEDLCAWLQNPEGSNCVAEFHEDLGSKCGATDPSIVSGTFAKREALDVCVLSKGGTVVFDPPVDLTKIVTGMPTTMKITNADGSDCGEITHTSSFSWSLKIAAPPASMTTSSTSSSSTTGAGGAEEDGESHYSNGTISVTRVGGDTITVACPAPDIHASDVLTAAESHTFNLNQSLSATPQNGCPQFADIIPQASLEISPGGVLVAGSVRLKIQFPPEAKAASASGAGGATSSTGSGTVTTLVPETVFYFDCAIPEAPLVCSNGLKDASETDIDCGGNESTPNCPVRCGAGQLCNNDCDCDASSFCGNVAGVVQCVVDTAVPPKVKGVCGGIICANLEKDTSESDVDCGGVCSPCVDGKKCGENKDCVSNSCTLGLCGPPTCMDSAANGAETDLNCGGPVCDKCIDGLKCLSATDCVSAGCSPDFVCSACFNMLKDGDESSADCGGATCAKCAEGKDCTQASDCETNVCSGNKCNGCSDTVKDGKETDKDCGGPFCSQCVDGKTCLAATDCVSNGCLNGLCSLCGNGVQNTGESDVDCGGTANASGEVCPRCLSGKVCVGDSDCVSGTTCGINNRCGSCADGILDGNESDIDCGASCPTKCPETKICNSDADCALGVCDIPAMGTTSSSGAGGAGGGNPVAPKGVCNTCTSGIKDGIETDVDCGGGTCTKCAVNKMCKVNIDCASGVCIANLCK